MAVCIERRGKVWTVIHSRPEARNAMDPESAEALVDAFLAFDRDRDAAVAVLWGEGGAFCAGWDFNRGASLLGALRRLEDIAYPLDERKGEHGQLPRTQFRALRSEAGPVR